MSMFRMDPGRPVNRERSAERRAQAAERLNFWREHERKAIAEKRLLEAAHRKAAEEARAKEALAILQKDLAKKEREKRPNTAFYYQADGRYRDKR